MRHIEYVEWIDSCSLPGWVYHEGAEGMKHDVIRSVGWVMYESPTHITMSAHVSPSCQHSPLAIPKVAITKRKRML